MAFFVACLVVAVYCKSRGGKALCAKDMPSYFCWHALWHVFIPVPGLLVMLVLWGRICLPTPPAADPHYDACAAVALT